MTKKPLKSTNPDILAASKALRRAARRAFNLGIATGTPVYVIRDGRIVDLTRAVGHVQPALATMFREPAAAYKTRKKSSGHRR